jgi:GH3 auxin-responsive promoter
MKWLVNEIMKMTLRRQLQRVERYMLQPGETQDIWFHALLDTAKNTEFGKKYGFADIKTHEEYARRVPIHDYDAVKDSINRMMHGERDILWPGEVSWYSKSSGTTSDKSKFIPVTPANLEECHIAGSWDAMALLYQHRDDLEIFRRKNLLMPGSFTSFPEHPNTYYGDVSAVLTQHMPFVARWFYTPDFETALLPNFEEKIHRVAELCSERDDIVMFGGVPTWIIVLFRLILEKTGKQNMLEVWPHLQAYMHGGVGFGLLRSLFPATTSFTRKYIMLRKVFLGHKPILAATICYCWRITVSFMSLSQWMNGKKTILKRCCWPMSKLVKPTPS